MDPPPTSFSGRRRSSVIDPTTPPSLTSASPTPRKASLWDTTPGPSATPSASDISSRRSSATTDGSSLAASGYSDAGSVASRKASAWDDSASMSGSRASVSDIAGRRATAVDRPPWDVFSGAPPGYEGSTWAWMSEIVSMTSGTSGDRKRIFYAGNINFIFEMHTDKNLAITDVESIMYAYGVKKASAQAILDQVDPQKSGMFETNSQNKQILLDSVNTNFSHSKEILSNVRHASKCFEKNLLSPLHFAGFVIDMLKGVAFLGNEPPFMILGMYSILGVLEGSANRNLTTKDVKTFTKLWKVNNSDEVEDLLNMIEEDHNGSISCWSFYNLLYRRNLFGKQRIQVFDTQGQQNPNLFFSLMDKDEDGFLSSSDLRRFAAIFGRTPSNEAIDRVTRKLDVDGDGKISMEDFLVTMAPVFDGITWEFWLVVILLTLEL